MSPPFPFNGRPSVVPGSLAKKGGNERWRNPLIQLTANAVLSLFANLPRKNWLAHDNPLQEGLYDQTVRAKITEEVDNR